MRHAAMRGHMLALLVIVNVAAEQRLHAVGRNLRLANGTDSAFVLRAVDYSPAAWGTDATISWGTGAWGTTDSTDGDMWSTLFNRDLVLMKEIGVNAVRLQHFFVTDTHGTILTDFLDQALAFNISVLLSYELPSSGTWLGDAAGILGAGAKLGSFLDGLNAHPALAMVFLGDGYVNTEEAGYICDFTRVGSVVLGQDCQFGEYTFNLASALNTLCGYVRAKGLACSVPLADVPLPAALAAASGTSQNVVEWMRLMVPHMPNMDVLSAPLAPLNDVTVPLDFALNFSALLDATDAADGVTPLPPKPFLVFSWGIDAYDASEWVAAAGSHDARFPGANASYDYYVLAGDDDEVVPSASAAVAQANWLVALASTIERRAASCSFGAAASSGLPDCSLAEEAPVAGGVLRSWRDEWWRTSAVQSTWLGGEQGSCAPADRGNSSACAAMAQICPPVVPANPWVQTPCGSPFAGRQPDGFVNGAWFGLLGSNASCGCAPAEGSRCAADRFAPEARPALFALQALWNPAAPPEVATSLLAAAVAAVGPLTDCPVAPVACDAKGPRLQRVAGSFGLQLDCSPWLMRAICYSPVPFGLDPGYSEPWGDMFTDEYEGLWRHDLEPKPNPGACSLTLNPHPASEIEL